MLLEGRDLLTLDEARMREVRGNRMSMIFQEPMTSLNPVFTVGEQIAEGVRLHRRGWIGARRLRARSRCSRRSASRPRRRACDDYPHQFSGGMRQRVMIAMALACEPGVLIADEPTTALDVTVQAQIFDLISALRARTGAAVILITHDMGVIAEMTDRVAVMYAGRIVEEGPTVDVLETPQHPYTRGLIGCAPGRRTTAVGEPLEEIPGTVPSLLERRGGCAFADRCAQRAAEVPRTDCRPRLGAPTEASPRPVLAACRRTGLRVTDGSTESRREMGQAGPAPRQSRCSMSAISKSTSRSAAA